MANLSVIIQVVITFSYDITEFLNKDGSENTIAVQVTNKQPSSRWYSGSGIYRDVTFKLS